MVREPMLGYFLDPIKINLVLSPRIVLQLEALFCGYSLKIVTGRRYLGGFVGEVVVQAR